MAGGGGDAPPLPASNGGEFLLSLLQKAPHHHYQSRLPPQQQPSPVLDPAVAAVGPTLPIQPPWGSSPPSSSNGRDHYPHWPNSQSPSPPNFNFLGFHQNPYSSPPTPNQFPQFGTSQFNQMPANLADDFRKLGLGQQELQQKLNQTRKPESSVAKLSNGLDRNLNLSSSNSSVEFRRVNYDSKEEEVRGRGKQVHRTMPPPGFGNKPRGGGNVDRERQSSSEFVRIREGFVDNERVRRLGGEDGRMRGNGGGGMGLSAQLDRPGPPAGTSLHSVSASEIEESMMNLEGGERVRKDGDGVEDVGQQLLEDERDEKNDAKQHHKVKTFSSTVL